MQAYIVHACSLCCGACLLFVETSDGHCLMSWIMIHPVRCNDSSLRYNCSKRPPRKILHPNHPLHPRERGSKTNAGRTVVLEREAEAKHPMASNGRPQLKVDSALCWNLGTHSKFVRGGCRMSARVNEPSKVSSRVEPSFDVMCFECLWFNLEPQDWINMMICKIMSSSIGCCMFRFIQVVCQLWGV